LCLVCRIAVGYKWRLTIYILNKIHRLGKNVSYLDAVNKISYWPCYCCIFWLFMDYLFSQFEKLKCITTWISLFKIFDCVVGGIWVDSEEFEKGWIVSCVWSSTLYGAALRGKWNIRGSFGWYEVDFCYALLQYMKHNRRGCFGFIFVSRFHVLRSEIIFLTRGSYYFQGSSALLYSSFVQYS
jgi:hypothetical protein